MCGSGRGVFKGQLGILHSALQHAKVGQGAVMASAHAITKAYTPPPPGAVTEGADWSLQRLRPHLHQLLPLQQVWWSRLNTSCFMLSSLVKLPNVPPYHMVVPIEYTPGLLAIPSRTHAHPAA